MGGFRVAYWVGPDAARQPSTVLRSTEGISVGEKPTQ